jgi:protein involved in polysaccharide export with SLBB domain
MKNLAFAVFLQIAILTISVTAQVKPNAANKPTSITAGTTKSPVPLLPIASSETQVYRVGISDVLDIQLSQNPTTKSTLYTVLPDGLLEFELAGEPFSVVGLTTKEIAEQLRQRIKVLDRPTVNVSVREYASHRVTLVGFVSAPGTKILRREAVPLFVLLAEAIPLDDAAKATIIRNGQTVTVDLKANGETSTLIGPGDVIKVRPD